MFLPIEYAAANLSSHGTGDVHPTSLGIFEHECLKMELPDMAFLLMGALAGIGAETVKFLSETGVAIVAA
jgi:hypothetical protein